MLGFSFLQLWMNNRNIRVLSIVGILFKIIHLRNYTSMGALFPLLKNFESLQEKLPKVGSRPVAWIYQTPLPLDHVIQGSFLSLFEFRVFFVITKAKETILPDYFLIAGEEEKKFIHIFSKGEVKHKKLHPESEFGWPILFPETITGILRAPVLCS